MNEVEEKEQLFLSLLQHKKIKTVRSAGLWLAVEFADFKTCKAVIDRCIDQGVITDWFLFAPNCMRIAPPLIITIDEIKNACSIILKSIGE